MTLAKNTPVSIITADPAMQARMAGSDAETISLYAQAMLEGAIFPPVKAVWDGEKNHLYDGFHTLAATIESGGDAIDVDVVPGTRRDAWKLALGANATHGLSRTNADKREAVRRALADEELSKESDRAIAKLCRVDHQTVASVRRDVVGGGGEIPTRATKRDRVDEQPSAGNVTKGAAPERNADTGQADSAYQDADGNPLESREKMLEAQLAETQSELQRVSDEKAVEGLPSFEREDAKQTIADLREQLRQRDATIESLKASRDSYMEQATQAIRQVRAMQNKLDRAGVNMKPAKK